MAQMRYGFTTPKGGAGGILDLAPYEINTFLNEENTGVMKHGVGVVVGSVPGTNVKLPAAGAKATDFLGVVVNNRTTERDLEGGIHIKNGAALGVMRYGRVLVRLAADVEPAFGDAVYLITSGDNAGCFTNDADGNVAIKAKFVGGVDTAAAVAPIELYNQAQEVVDLNEGGQTE